MANLQYSNIRLDELKKALNSTTEKRGSREVVKNYSKIVDMVRNSEIMRKQWNNYQKDFGYAAGIAFEDACNVVVKLMSNLTTI